MNAPLHFAPPGEVRAAAGLVEAVASWDECVLLMGATGAGAVTVGAVLDRAVPDLSARRVRCVRVRAPASGGLALRGLMAQVVGRDDPDALTDEGLEAGFAVLTEPGDGYDRVALMVEDAHALLPPAVRYIQLACRSGPLLRVVLAGRPGLEAVLAGEEFADLRRRFTRRLVLPGPGADGEASDERPGLFSAAPLPPLDMPEAPTPFVRVRDAAWTVTKLGLAASLVVWMVRLGSPQPPPAPQRPSFADSADPSEAPAAAPPAAAPPAVTPPAAAPPRAGSGAPLAVWTTRWEDVPAPPGVATPDPGGRAVPGRADPAPAALAPMLPPVVADPVVPPAVPPPAASSPAAPPFDTVPLGTVPPVVSPPAVADVPSPIEAETAARGHAEPSPPASALTPVPIPPAVEDMPPERSAPSAERDGVADAPRERPQPPADREAATAAVPDPPETPARDAGHATAPAPEPTPAPLALVPPAPAPPVSVPPEPATAALPLPPVPPPQLPPSQPPPRAAGMNAEGRPSAPQPEAPNAPRRARAGTERAPVAATPTTTARADERRCRDLVLKAQLGETLSDAEKQFLRGGCRAD